MPKGDKGTALRLKRAQEKLQNGEPLTESDAATLGNGAIPAYCDSTPIAAQYLGRSIAELNRAKEAGCPGWRARRVYLHDIEEWFAIEDNAKKVSQTRTIDELKREEIAVRIARQTFFLNRDKGDFLEAGTVSAQVMAMGERVKATLRSALEDELPPILQGMSAAQIRVHMKALNDRLCVIFQEDAKKMMKDSTKTAKGDIEQTDD